VRARSAERSFFRGLERVRAVDEDAAAWLRHLPVDDRAGARLSALAALAEAHHELSERVAGQGEALRRQFAEERAAPPAPKRRAQRAR
jgi:hypothetical protein